MRRERRFHIEGLENRELPSAVVASMIANHVHAAQTAGNGSGGSAGGSQGGTTSTSNQFLDPTGKPIPHERARQAVRFVFEGKYLQSRGRFEDLASTTYIKGVGSSTYFLHGDLQLGAYVPKDATLPTSGSATSFDRNNNANSSFGFDLSGSTADLDKGGRPTRFTWTIDTNLSSGIFGQANGTGTVKVKYIPSGRPRPGVMSEGRAIVVIQGNAYTLKTNNILNSPLGQTNIFSPDKIRF